MGNLNNIVNFDIERLGRATRLNISGSTNIAQMANLRFIGFSFVRGDYVSHQKGAQNVYIDPDVVDLNYLKREIFGNS